MDATLVEYELEQNVLNVTDKFYNSLPVTK